MLTYKDILIKITKDLLLDLSSLRVQLIIFAFLFNLFLFTNKASDTVLLASIGLLTTVYYFYFRSKEKQAQNTTVKSKDIEE